MLNRILLFVSAGLLGLAAPTAQAQNYRPFGPGRTYHYRQASGPTNGPFALYTFQVDSSQLLPGGDSLLLFNETRPLIAPGFQPGRSHRVNLYGGWMRWSAATGTATFSAAIASGSVELRTHAATGQSWQFAPGVQATMGLCAVATVLGQPDSVRTITLSDGGELQLSRRYGIIGGTDFTFYLGQTYRPTPPTGRYELTLAGLPEAGLSGVDLRWSSLFDFQPGDSLFYRHHDFQDGSSSCATVACTLIDIQRTSAFVVRSRQFSAAGDSLIVWGSDVTTAGAGPVRPLRFGRFGPVLSAAAAAGATGGAIGGSLGVYAIEQQTDSLGFLPVVRMNVLIPDASTDRWYAPGLGCVLARDGYSFCCYGFTEVHLIGFYKNGSIPLRWGNTHLPPPLAAPAPAQLPLPATLTPNPAPAGAAPALSITLDRPQAVSLTLYDALGRLAWQQTTGTLAAGPQWLPVAAGERLTPGLYRLRVTLADGRQRLLPLVRE